MPQHSPSQKASPDERLPRPPPQRPCGRPGHGGPAREDQRVPRHAIRDLPLRPRAGASAAPGSFLAANQAGEQGKRITRISLAECLEAALKSEATLEEWFENERTFGAEKAIEDVHKLLADRVPLVDLVADRMPHDPDPRKDVVFIVRTGALFPVYRTFSLLEQLKGRVVVPTVLFYQGDLDGAAGLRFMGVLEAEHNYRPKIF
jgi:hypothetical protein